VAAVHVHTTNNRGFSVALLLDDVRDAERIAYLQKMARLEDLASVEVKPAILPAVETPAKPAKAAAK